jgi:hypothetical protein
MVDPTRTQNYIDRVTPSQVPKKSTYKIHCVYIEIELNLGKF